MICQCALGAHEHTVSTPSMLSPTPIHMSPGSTARSSTVAFVAVEGSGESSCAQAQTLCRSCSAMSRDARQHCCACT